MAITIKGTGGLDTPSINATANAVFTGPVDFTQAVLKGVNKWQVVGSDTNLQSNRNYFANTRSASLTLTLPISANVGDTIVVQDSEGFASSNNITINRNGNLIDGSARNAILNVDRDGIALTFESATNGFVTRKENTDKDQDNNLFGTVQGFALGGGTIPGVGIDSIESYPFASDTNSTDLGNLTVARGNSNHGHSSKTHGYVAGGFSNPPATFHNVIDKFPFATPSDNAVDVGDLNTVTRSGTSQNSVTDGYVSGGDAPSITNTIQKFPFASDTNATALGNLTNNTAETPAGVSSDTDGYCCGGNVGPPAAATDKIDKHPFASDNDATAVSTLTATTNNTVGTQSEIRGYICGGGPPTVDKIERFGFANDSNGVDVANLTAVRNGLGRSTSSTHGYLHGGQTPAPATSNEIQKFSFASETNATDVGELQESRNSSSGAQD